MDGVAVAIDPEKMDPRTRAVYDEVVGCLDGEDSRLHDVLEQAASEAIEANLDAMYEQRDGDLEAVLQQALQG